MSSSSALHDLAPLAIGGILRPEGLTCTLSNREHSPISPSRDPPRSRLLLAIHPLEMPRDHDFRCCKDRAPKTRAKDTPAEDREADRAYGLYGCGQNVPSVGFWRRPWRGTFSTSTGIWEGRTGARIDELFDTRGEGRIPAAGIVCAGERAGTFRDGAGARWAGPRSS